MTETVFKTDMYEFTMLEAALKAGTAHRKSVFELFARKLPEGRRYGVVAGTSRAIEAVSDFLFSYDEIRFLELTGKFSKETIQYLRDFSFKGEISGYEEGDIYFPNSPILTVEGTFAECVLLETVLLSIFNHDSAVASAASRMVNAADGRPLIEMGSRRANDESAVVAARAAYIAGFAGTSNVLADKRYGVPSMGTSAHAFTLLFDDEKEAFRAQVDALGADTTLLVDTYDIEQGIRNAVEVAGTELGGIRIDSGDLHEETRNARKLLDELGAVNTKIILSSDMDEYTLNELVEAGVPFDGAGVGTRVVTGSGHPTSAMVYKLVERENAEGEMVPVAKRSSSKGSVGGKKTPYRIYSESGKINGEFFTVGDVDLSHMKNVRKVQKTLIKRGTYSLPTLKDARKRHAEVLEELPAGAKLISNGQAAFFCSEYKGEHRA